MKKGTGLIEIIIYATIFVLVSIFVVNSVIIINNAIIRIRLERRLAVNGEQALGRLIREIRLASDINASSTFGADPGSLSLKTAESQANPEPVDADIYLNSGRLVFKKGTVPPIFLTDAKISVTGLVFRQIVSTSSKAVKVEMKMETGSSPLTATSTFYGTAILKNSY